MAYSVISPNPSPRFRHAGTSLGKRGTLVISGLAGYVRGWRALFAAAACLYLLIIPAYLTLRSSRAEFVSTRARLTEMSGLRVEYMALKSEANGFEKRLVLSMANGALQEMDGRCRDSALNTWP
ncbi:MAG: hypothetical protein HZB83_02020 [Deltaproteobacteria bacterium]|nr:hypothetical protein [Deltaproteobacteria bacterium]